MKNYMPINITFSPKIKSLPEIRRNRKPIQTNDKIGGRIANQKSPNKRKPMVRWH